MDLSLKLDQLPKLIGREPDPLRTANPPTEPFDESNVDAAAPAALPNDPPHVCQAHLHSKHLPSQCAYLAASESPSDRVILPTPVAHGSLTVN